MGIRFEKGEYADTYFSYDLLNDFRVSNNGRNFSKDNDCNYLFVSYEKQEGEIVDGGA